MILTEHTVHGVTTPLVVAPLGDIQWTGDKHELAFDHLQEHIARCVEAGAWFIGMGDYIDFMSPSNRESWRKGHFYDNARKVVDDKALELLQDCFDTILKPTKGRWLGILSGHHYADLLTGINTDQKLCELLGAPYLGVNGIVRLHFHEKTHSQEVKIWAHHGCGSSQFAHGPLLKLDKISRHWGCHLFLMGHQTKKAHGLYDFIEPIWPNKGQPRLEHRTIHMVGTGGWTKGYVEGDEEGTYVEKGMMNPVALGQPIVYIKPAWRRNKDGLQCWEPGITVEA